MSDYNNLDPLATTPNHKRSPFIHLDTSPAPNKTADDENARSSPAWDLEDEIWRCKNCHWELDVDSYNACNTCEYPTKVSDILTRDWAVQNTSEQTGDEEDRDSNDRSGGESDESVGSLIDFIDDDEVGEDASTECQDMTSEEDRYASMGPSSDMDVEETSSIGGLVALVSRSSSLQHVDHTANTTDADPQGLELANKKYDNSTLITSSPPN